MGQVLGHFCLGYLALGPNRWMEFFDLSFYWKLD